MAQEGWICPRCGKVNAPWMSQCTCGQDEMKKVTCGSNTITCTCIDTPKCETNIKSKNQMICS